MFDFNLVWNFRISFVFRFYHSITYHGEGQVFF